MLPAPADTFGNIRHVLPAAFASVRGQTNQFKLAPVSHAIVIMVDGLGFENLRQSKGVAKTLAAAMTDVPELFCGFPSSTVASIASLGTGKPPSEHGLFGYRIFDRTAEAEHNLLSGMDKYTILDYLTANPLSETNALNVVTLVDYVDSGFTRATMHGALHFSEPSMQSRFEKAADLSKTELGVTYLYVPELDQTAHAVGWTSETWRELLAELETNVLKLLSQVGSSVGVLLIADHGVIDVLPANHLHLDEVLATDELSSLGGDPRASYLYFADVTAVSDAMRRLSNWIDGRGEVFTFDEAVASGLFTEPLVAETELLPDLIVLPAEGFACYHRGISKPSSMRMVAQHGGLSFAETALPFLRLGAYSTSDFVP